MKNALVVIALLFATFVPRLAMADDLDNKKQEGTSALTVSMIALTAVQAAANEDGLVQAIHNFYPNVSRNHVRGAYFTLFIAATSGAHFVVWHNNPWIRPDYERLAWSIGEFVTAYFVSYMYFHQPVVPGRI